MVDDRAQLGADGTAAVNLPEQSAQGNVGRGEQAAFNPAEQAALRAELIKGHPNAVHELIQGGSTQEMIASVTNAEAAYHRVHEAIMAATPTAAGGGVRSGDATAGSALGGNAATRLSGLGLISEGLRQNDASGQAGPYAETHGMARINNVGRR